MSTKSEPLLEMRGIRVTFGVTDALVKEDFAVYPGEIVGLLGHNGAGKSTLVNVATGAVRPNEGTMTMLNVDIPLRGRPAVSNNHGIKVIHQEPALADNLTIADNILMGSESERAPKTAKAKVVSSALAALGSDLDPNRPVSSLDLSQRQIVDLSRALSTKLNVLFLDEPTGALGRAETDRIHQILRDLAAEGKGIVYVSHRLRDILEVCTRIVVLRDGRTVMNTSAENLSVADLSEALSPGFGKEDVHTASFDAGPDDAPRLSISLGTNQARMYPGEIVGLFGMASGPQFQLLESLFGMHREPIDASLDSAPFSPHNPRQAMVRGVYYVTANREREALFKELTAAENLVMPWLDRHSHLGLISERAVSATYHIAQDALLIRGAPPNAPITAFSGGNRQKICLGRWMFAGKPSVLLLAQPTQGVDVGARREIARSVRKIAEQGVLVLVASSENDEISLMCDRTWVTEGTDWTKIERHQGWEQEMLRHLVTNSPQENME